MSEPFLAEIRMFGGNFAPKGWALCNGQLLSIAQNTALFSLLGTTFGGNGQTTFGLPDLRGRLPIHAGQGPGLSNRSLGEMAGSESVTVVVSQMPAHNHTFAPPCSNVAGGVADPTNNYPAGQDVNTGPFNYNSTTTGAEAAGLTGVQGGGQPLPTMPPFLCVNFIIALEGIFPSRN